MRSKTAFGFMLLVLVLMSVRHAVAEPSAGLSAALSKPCAALSLGKSDPALAIRQTLRKAQVNYRIGVEQTDTSIVGQREFKLAAGTLKNQLDQIAQDTELTYQCNGDWINLYPRAVAADSDYVMNRRLPGKVIVGGTAPTEIVRWLNDNHVSFARVFSGMRRTKVDYRKVLGRSITLDNPTLREYVNAQEELFDCDTSSLFIRHMSDPRDPKSTRFVVDQQSYNSSSVAVRDTSTPVAPDGVKK